MGEKLELIVDPHDTNFVGVYIRNKQGKPEKLFDLFTDYVDQVFGPNTLNILCTDTTYSLKIEVTTTRISGLRQKP